MKSIKILCSAFMHAGYSSDFQKSKYVVWDFNPTQHYFAQGSSISTLVHDPKEPIVLVDNFIPLVKPGWEKAVAWLLEPPVLIPSIYHWVSHNHHLFSYVVTYEKSLLDLGSNFVVVPGGGCWIPPLLQQVYPKAKSTSIIVSGKRFLVQHNLRHAIVEHFARYMDVYGRGYNPIISKIEGLKDYRFSVTVENYKSNEFGFTEKLIDCFATGTIPVYCGPSLEGVFNLDGVIKFDNLEELGRILPTLTPALYTSKLDAIQDNFTRMEDHIIAEDWIWTHYLSKLYGS